MILTEPDTYAVFSTLTCDSASPSRERFIEQALASIQFDDYFGRTLDQQARGAYEQSKLLFSAFFAASDVSLRTINQAIHHLGLVLATLRPDRRFFGFAVAVALIIRTMDPASYREFMNGEIEDAVVAQRIFAKIDVDDERREHQRALFETVLIVGMLEIGNEVRRSLTDSTTPLLDHYQSVVSSNADGGSRDRSVFYAKHVVEMVNQFRSEAVVGSPPGFVLAARRLELLSPDLVGDPNDGK